MAREWKCRHRTKIFRIQFLDYHSNADYINISEITWISLASPRMRKALIYSNNSIYCRLYCVCCLRYNSIVYWMAECDQHHRCVHVKICLKHRMKGIDVTETLITIFKFTTNEATGLTPGDLVIRYGDIDMGWLVPGSGLMTGGAKDYKKQHWLFISEWSLMAFT